MQIKLVSLERSLYFYPKTNWEPGLYEITIDSRLEDLAGNNLNHVFDKDIENSSDTAHSETKELKFVIP